MFSSYWTDIVFTLELLQVSNLIFNKEIQVEYKQEIKMKTEPPTSPSLRARQT